MGDRKKLDWWMWQQGMACRELSTASDHLVTKQELLCPTSNAECAAEIFQIYL